jgi:hypothetical protein
MAETHICTLREEGFGKRILNRGHSSGSSVFFVSNTKGFNRGKTNKLFHAPDTTAKEFAEPLQLGLEEAFYLVELERLQLQDIKGVS